jgi:NAD(P)H-dependent FMN reductase
MHQLKVILASTRTERKGPAVADWFMGILDEHPEFESELLDLKEIDLPFLDEPEHPRLQHYRHEHTRRWGKIIGSADAFVIVTCEYNHGYPAPLKNALDFVYHEWNYKPASFVSYGGVAGGTRAASLLRPVVTTQKMMPLPEAVHIPFFAEHINEDGIFEAPEVHGQAAHIMLKELARWAECLKGMRKKGPEQQ